MRRRQALINVRKQAQLTQQKLGGMVGLTGGEIGNIERAIVNSSPEIWDKLEDLFNIPQRTLREIFEVEEVYHPLEKER